jgi:flagellar biosynthesis protein FliQ
MGTEWVGQVGTEAMKTILFVSAPLLLTAIVVGLTVSILQAITQIQEMTLTFVPKILALMAGLFFFSHYMIDRLLGFTQDLIQMIPVIIR